MDTHVASVAPAEFFTAKQSPAPLIDVRTPAEFASGAATGAVNIPLSELTAERVRRVCGDTNIHFICRSGARGEEACRKMASCGLKAVNITGGLNAWMDAGGPFVHGESTVISLERQVRIAAGGLVFIGTVLSYLISTTFLLIPLFVGAGLVFAGVTNSCGMAMLLARMPWNNRK